MESLNKYLPIMKDAKGSTGTQKLFYGEWRKGGGGGLTPLKYFMLTITIEDSTYLKFLF